MLAEDYPNRAWDDIIERMISLPPPPKAPRILTLHAWRATIVQSESRSLKLRNKMQSFNSIRSICRAAFGFVWVG